MKTKVLMNSSLTAGFFFNGNIHTLSHSAPIDWLLTFGGLIVALGSKENRPTQLPFHTQAINLNRKTVFPAFTDAHTHLVATARQLGQVRLDEAASLAQAVQILERSKVQAQKKSWIRGGGFNKNLWLDGQPNAAILDQIFGDQPVAIESKDFHALWVNSAALKRAGIDTRTLEPAGGKIGRNADGTLNGLLYERALSLVYKVIPKDSDEVTMQEVEALQDSMLAKGITCVHSMEGIEEFKLLQKMEQENRLKISVRLYVPESEADALVRAGVQSGFGSDVLKIAGVKFFTDGALGSQTAFMIKPYEHSAQVGVPHMTGETLKQRVAFFNAHGLNVAVHAIGDAAVIMALDAFEFARRQSGKKMLNRMEHAQLVPVNQIKRFADLDVLASVQPVHIADDVYTAETYWGERCARAYPFKDFQEAHVPMAFGSDTPVADYDPFKGMYAALERKYHSDPAEQSWHPEQKLSMQQALWAYTSGPALAVGEKTYSGSLEKGKRADFVVLNQEINNLPAEALLQTKVEMTVKHGCVLYP